MLLAVPVAPSLLGLIIPLTIPLASIVVLVKLFQLLGSLLLVFNVPLICTFCVVNVNAPAPELVTPSGAVVVPVTLVNASAMLACSVNAFVVMLPTYAYSLLFRPPGGVDPVIRTGVPVVYP